jgi:ribosome recycling factor
MEATDLNSLKAEAKKKMEHAVEFGRKELAGVRTGRATTNMLDTVHVDAYGSLLPLNQVAQLSIPEPTMIMAQPFDASLIKAVEKGIQMANLGLNPTNDGKMIRIPIPSLTDERRKELSRLVHKYAEDGRNAIRNVRRVANDAVKKLLKDHKISEDEERRALDETQKMTDAHVAIIDDLQKKKDHELLGK